MNKIILLLFLICAQINGLIAQSSSRTIELSIQSTVMNEERVLKIHLPLDYKEGGNYPVIYITDGGSSNFEVAKNYIDVLSDPTYDLIPTSILVGIVHVERNKDLNVFRRESGIRFMKYLIEEVVPMIDSTYSTSGFNAMIGHSNGAEYNHFLLLAKENPFRGFISISTNFNTDVKQEIADFFKTYRGAKLYYFLANGNLDAPSRTQAGNDFEEIAIQNPNEQISLKKNSYQAGHINLVPLSLVDGLRHLFQDYGNIEAYPSIVDYAENYLKDLKENYGIVGAYDFYSLDPYYMDIIKNKKADEYAYLLKFIEKHKLWKNAKTDEPAGLDPINIANAYYMMGMMPEVISYWNKSLEEFESIEDAVFYSNLSKLMKAYENENRLAEAVEFLEKAKAKLPEKYALNMTYKMAKISLENKVAIEKGKEALTYCKVNYRENGLFTLKDLDRLEKL